MFLKVRFLAKPEQTSFFWSSGLTKSFDNRLVVCGANLTDCDFSIDEGCFNLYDCDCNLIYYDFDW